MDDANTKSAGYLGVLSRRRLLKQATAGGFALGVAAIIGCGDDDDDDDAAAPTAGATTAPALTPVPPGRVAAPVVTPDTKRGGILRFIQPQGYQGTNIDPYRTDTSVGINIIMGKMYYESLLNVDFSNEEWRNPYTIVPWLAKSWEQQPDGVTYVMNLQEGVKFHNGATLTSDDISFTYDRATAEDSIGNNWGRRVAGLEVADAQTIRLIAPSADPEFLEAVNSYIGQVAVMSRAAYDAGVDFSSEAVGTGPFTVKDWRADSETQVHRFEDYWGGGVPKARPGSPARPYLDGLVISPGDDATQSAAFIAGELDVLSRNDRVQAKPILDAVPDAQTSGWPSDYIYGIGFNQHRKPFDDERVRKAVHLAISREDVDAAANFGDGVISGPMTITRSGYTHSHDELLKLPGFRPEKDADRAEAKKLMSAAGVGDGFSCDLVYNTRLAVAPVYGEATQPQLKEHLGIDAKLVPMDTASYSVARSAVPADIDGMYVHLSGGVARPGTATRNYHSSSNSAQSIGWNSPEVDALIDEAKKTFEDGPRGELFQKIEQAMIDTVLWASISAPSLVRMYQPWIHDWRDNRAQRQSIQNPSWIWMEVDKAPANRQS